jgi:hypothetical protein
VLRLAKIVSFFLISLWLPATSHCQLESLGLDAIFSCPEQSSHDNHAGENPCHKDSCQLVESGQFSLSPSRIIPALTPLSVCVFVHCLLHVAPSQPSCEIFAVRQDETLPMQRIWQFARRAALPARAPDSVV